MSSMLMTVRNLTIATSATTLVRDVNLDVRQGAATGLVGESGSGKSMTLRAIMGLLPEGVRVQSGTLTYGENTYDMRDDTQLASLRGKKTTLIFQEPGSALNPLLKVGRQITDAAGDQRGLPAERKRSLALGLLRAVGMRDAETAVDSYPFELSGGMKQRVMIAAATALNPGIILCDEPTTALDVTIQAQVLKLLTHLMTESKLGLLYVSHDLSVVSQLCSHISVMHSGIVVESGAMDQVFSHPKDDYTKKLIDATPSMSGPYPVGPERSDRPVASIDKVSVSFATRGLHFFGHRPAKKVALKEVSLAINRGEILGLVGESGSGKSTIARVLCGLQPVDEGSVTFQGSNIGRRRSPVEIRGIQMVFQDPNASLDPSKTIRQTLSEIVKAHNIVPRASVNEYCEGLMRQCQLDKKLLDRKPSQLSGGQKQRVAVARALALKPDLLIADEPTSALDVSVQAEILALLEQLSKELNLSILFISHDLAVVRNLCSRVAVIHNGVIVEQSTTQEVFENPADPYTATLLESIPTMRLSS